MKDRLHSGVGDEENRARPRLTRQDSAADRNPPLWINAYSIVSPDGRIEEVALSDALEGRAAAGESQSQPQSQSQSQSQPHYWIDVEVKGNLEAALSHLHKSVLDPLLLQNQTEQQSQQDNVNDDTVGGDTADDTANDDKDDTHNHENSTTTFLRRHLQNAQQWHTPQVLVMPDAVVSDDADTTFIVMRVLGNGIFGHSPSSVSKRARRPHAVRHAAALCWSRTLVTVTFSCTTSSESLRQVFQVSNRRSAVGKKVQSLQVPQDTVRHILLEQPPHGLEPTAHSAGLWRWLSFHVGRTTTAAHRLRETLFEMAALEASELQLADIAYCKDSLLRLSAVVEEQNECVQQMAVVVLDADDKDEKTNNNNNNDIPKSKAAIRSARTQSAAVLRQSTASTERLVFRLEKRIADVDHAYDANQQNRIQRRLNVLTVTSAIFLPLTLLTGMYGMNWSNMPELETEYGYFVLLGVMAILTIVLLWNFYRAGWLE